MYCADQAEEEHNTTAAKYKGKVKKEGSLM